MTRPIIQGIITELLSALPTETVADKVLALADKVMGKDAGEYWENPMIVHNLVATVLEDETMRLANPLLSVLDGATVADRDEIVQCTDQLQYAVVDVVTKRLRDAHNPVIRRSNFSNFWQYLSK